MTQPFNLPRPGAEIAEGRLEPLSRFWREWFRTLMVELHQVVTPPKAIVACNLTADDVVAEFDATGLGRKTGPYEWWAICNGNNGTPDLAGLFVRHNSTAAGGSGGSLTTSSNDTDEEVSSGVGTDVAADGHTHTYEPPYYELVYLMRTS